VLHLSPDATSLPELPVQPPGVAWPTCAWPEAPCSDPAVLHAVDEGFNASEDHLGLNLSLVVVHKGELIAERYGPTSGPDVALISWSMAKSFTHALVGIAIADNKLDLHGPAPVPAWSEPGDARAAITVDQLLRMTSGLAFVEDYVDDEISNCIEMLFGGVDDMGNYAASLSPAGPPDTIFNYSSGTTNILTSLLADIYGRGDDFASWANQVLFDRIGLDAQLTFDKTGTWVGSSFLHATARDFAKFGLLYMRDGMWDGERVLPERWVDYGRTVRAHDEDGAAYGAQWWIHHEERGSFSACGYETQRIRMDPLTDTIVVRLGKTPTELGPNVDVWLEKILLAIEEVKR